MPGKNRLSAIPAPTVSTRRIINVAFASLPVAACGVLAANQLASTKREETLSHNSPDKKWGKWNKTQKISYFPEKPAFYSVGTTVAIRLGSRIMAANPGLQMPRGLGAKQRAEWEKRL
jgi:hypothetical protein